MLLDPYLVLGRWVWFFVTLLNAKSGKLDSTLSKAPLKACHTRSRIEPSENDLVAALRSMVNAKAVEPDELPAKFLKLRLNPGPTVLQEFHWGVKLVWHKRKV